MIEETVKVVGVEGDRITIEATKKSACGGCSQKEGCGASAVSGLFSGKSFQLELDNSLGAKVGDMVVVGVENGAFLRMALRAYLAPLLVLIISAMLFSSLFASEWLVVVFSVAVMLGSFHIGRNRGASADLRLLRILSTSNNYPDIDPFKV